MFIYLVHQYDSPQMEMHVNEQLNVLVGSRIYLFKHRKALLFKKHNTIELTNKFSAPLYAAVACCFLTLPLGELAPQPAGILLLNKLSSW